MRRDFKRLPSVKISYDRQGMIFFTCRNYRNLPEREKRWIRALCDRVGGENADALFAFMTTDISWQQTCADFYISERTLVRLRKAFYESW